MNFLCITAREGCKTTQDYVRIIRTGMATHQAQNLHNFNIDDLTKRHAKVIAVVDESAGGRVVCGAHFIVHELTRTASTMGLMTLPSYQKMGLGAALVAYGRMQLREIDDCITTIRIHPGNVINVSAAKAFAKSGYVPKGAPIANPIDRTSLATAHLWASAEPNGTYYSQLFIAGPTSLVDAEITYLRFLRDRGL